MAHNARLCQRFGSIRKADGEIIGGNLKALLGANLAKTLEATDLITSGHSLVPVRVFGVKIKGATGVFDASSHILDGRRIVEIERVEDAEKKPPLDLVRLMLGKLQEARTLKDLCNETVEQVRRLIASIASWSIASSAMVQAR